MKHKISEKAFNQFLLWSSIFLLTISIHSILATYNYNRYDVKTFNCVDFTKEAVDYLSVFNIKSYQVVGICKDNQSLGHSWVGIDLFGTILNFEPQSLVVFNPEDEYEQIFVNRR